MGRATHHGPTVGRSIDQSGTTQDPYVVALAAVFFLPLLAVFFGSQVGSALYHLLRATCVRRRPPAGFAKLP